MENQLLGVLFDHVDDWVAFKDTAGIYQFCNQAFAQLVGCDRTQIIGHQDSAIPFNDEDLKTLLAEAIASDIYPCEKVINTDRFEIKVSSISDKLSLLKGTMLVGRKISASKETTELARQLSLLQSIYDGAETPIFAVDVVAPDSFKFASFNPSALRNMNVKRGTLIGKVPNEAIAHKYKICCDSQQPFSYEESIQFQDKETRWLTTLNPLKNSSGEIYQLVGTTLDITRRYEAEEHLKQKATELENALADLKRTQTQLVQSEKMSGLGQLVAGIAHEINNPVSFIYGNISSARDYIQDLIGLVALYQSQYPNPTDELREYVEEIELDYVLSDLDKLLDSLKTGADRIRKIVRSLRDFSALDEMGAKSFNIDQGLESTLMLLQSRLKRTSRRPEILVVQEGVSAMCIWGYPRQINQVFLNILSNAIDAINGCFHSGTQKGSDQPAIHIRTVLTELNSLRIDISDSGPGVALDIQSRLFDPFFTTKPVGQGTGIGLAIAYQIITQQHKGTLTCTSNPDRGATFSIELPLPPPC